MLWPLNAQSAQASGGLCDESVIVLNATEDRESDKLTDRRRRLSEFQVGIWNPMDGLRWPPTIAVAKVTAVAAPLAASL